MLTIKITKKAYQKLRYYTENCKYEISGLGKIREKTGYLEIYDIDIFKQKVSIVNSNLNPDTLASFLYEKYHKGESVKDYKVWWHSHSDMEVFFSDTDKHTIELSSEYPYLISIVTNKRGENKVRLDIFNPLRLTIPAKLEITLEEDIKLEKQCRTEIKQKITKSWPMSISKDKKRYLTPKSIKKA